MRREPETMQHTTQRVTLTPLVLCILLAAGEWLAHVPVEASGFARTRSRSVVLPVGRSALLTFQKMRRVEVIEPNLAEVVVVSINELSLYGRKRGETTLYVWDQQGVHEIALSITEPSPGELVAQELRKALGSGLSYSVFREDVVVVEGQVTLSEFERVHRIIEALREGPAEIVNLVTFEGEMESPAGKAAKGLQAVFGDEFSYMVWNDHLVLVQGKVGSQVELEKARTLLKAVESDAVKVVDLIEYEDARERPPVEEIAAAVGDDFRVWQVRGRTVAVEGTVTSAEDQARISGILKIFEPHAQILNLVQLAEPKPTINDDIALVQSALGHDLAVRPLGNQALAVEGTVATSEIRDEKRAILETLPVEHQVVDLIRVALAEKEQILVHARVAEINVGALSRLGVNWGQIAVTPANEIIFVDQPWIVKTEGGFDNILTIGAQVDALRQDNMIRILSQPNILVDDGGEAFIMVGGEIPVPVAQAGGGVSSVSVEWKPYGVKLFIKPNILENSDKINVIVEPEVSSLDYGNAVTLGGFTVPAMRTRKASSQLTITDGTTIFIGGLLQNEERKTVRKIPLLSSIPIIGELFKSRQFERGESELIIMITPEIIKEPEANEHPAP